jgi:formylglycine-generating enzyme required for sulfatase activity
MIILSIGLFAQPIQRLPVSDSKGNTSGELRACISKPGQGPEMVLIAGGSFEQGSSESEEGSADERPRHGVTLVKPFALARCEVTVGEFESFVDAKSYRTDAEKSGGCWVWNFEAQQWKQNPERNWRTPGFEQSDHHPVTCVSWNDAKAYLTWLNQSLDLPEGTYRLPSESEWEFAVRAGHQDPYPFGDGSQCDYANAADSALRKSGIAKNWGYADCDDGQVFTAPVAGRGPNAWGLYDLSGNVWEWVEDCWHDSYQSAPQDGGAWLDQEGGGCTKRSIRGGSWDDLPIYLRSADRFGDRADEAFDSTGFRLARTL